MSSLSLKNHSDCVVVFFKHSDTLQNSAMDMREQNLRQRGSRELRLGPWIRTGKSSLEKENIESTGLGVS